MKKKNTFLKNSKHIFHLLPVVLLGIAGFLYPGWITDGYLEDWYPRIGAFVAIYVVLLRHYYGIYKIKRIYNDIFIYFIFYIIKLINTCLFL